VYYIDIGVDAMQVIEVERGVVVPMPRVVYSYPYQEMDVGDSFTVPVSARQKVLNANYRASKRLGLKFMAKTEGDVVRVWRVA
jgi:hypothetical protein